MEIHSTKTFSTILADRQSLTVKLANFEIKKLGFYCKDVQLCEDRASRMTTHAQISADQHTFVLL